MASVNKIILCPPTQSKAAFVDLECEVISLPHGMKDTLYVADCFTGADVKVRLEHSPDGEAWTTVRYKEITGGGGTAAEWGNEKYLDTTPKRPSGPDTDYKDKHVSFVSNFSGKDIFQHLVSATDPFNVSMWLRSTVEPATSLPEYQNTKFINMYGEDGTHGSNVGFLKQEQNDPATNWDLDNHKILVAGGSFTWSWWMKFDPADDFADPATGQGYGATNWWKEHIIAFEKHYNFGAYVIINSDGELELFMEGTGGIYTHIPLYDVSGLEDNVWRHFVLTYDGTYSTAGTPADSFQFYINGVSGGAKPAVESGDALTHEPIGNASVDGLLTLGSRGDLDDISMWNIKFSAAEIIEMYNSGKAQLATEHSQFSAANCWCYYNFQDPLDSTDGTDTYGVGNQIMDQSGNGNHLTPNESYAVATVIDTHPTSGVDSGLYVASDVDPSSTYSPILFRSGGKIAEADAFDNIKALKLIEGAGETKNKFLQVNASSQTAIDAAVTTSTDFTYNTWLKTEQTPATTHVPAQYKNTKYFKMSGKSPTDYTTEYSKQGLFYLNATATNFDEDKHKILTTVGNEGFTFSWWCKFNTGFDSDPALTTISTNKFNVAQGAANTYHRKVAMLLSYGGWSRNFTLHCNLSGELELMIEWGSLNYVHIPLLDISTYKDGSNDDVWRHFVFTYDGTWASNAVDSFTFYENSVSTKGAGYTMTGTAGTNEPFTDLDTSCKIGAPYDMDSWSMWNICLNQIDINELYNSGKALPATQHSKFNSTDCWLAFDGEHASDGIIDISGSSTDIDCIQDISGNDNHISASSYSDRQPWLNDHVTTFSSTSLYVAADVAEVNTTTAAPVIFRNGGKQEAAVENLYGFTYPTDVAFFGFEFTDIAQIGPWGGMGGGANTGFPDLDDANSFAGWIFIPTGWNAASNKRFYIYGSGNAGTQHLTWITPTSTTSLIFEIQLSNTGPVESKIRATVAYTENAWHHFAITKALSDEDAELADWSLYVNKVPQTLADTDGNLPFDFNTEYINSYETKVGYNWTALAFKIDDFSFWGKELDQGEVDNLYDNKPNLKGTADLKGYYRFGDGDSVGDGSGTIDAITAAGVPTIYDMSGSGSGVDFTKNVHYVGGGEGDTAITALAEADPTYRVATVVGMGDGLTISLSDKYTAANPPVYTPAGGQGSKLVISLDGFENDADELIVYNNDLTDGVWHNLQLSYDGGTAYAAAIKVFIDGDEKSQLQVTNEIVWANSHLENVSDTATRAVIGGTGILETGGIGGDDNAHNFQGDIMDTSFHSEKIIEATAALIYNSGTPVDLDEVTGILDSAVKCWWQFEETNTTTPPLGVKNAGSRTTFGNDLVFNNFHASGNNFVALAITDTEYFKESRFGEGLTLSLTDKVDYDADQGLQWKEAGGEVPSLLVSFNGFEDDAEQWVAYKCNQGAAVQRNESYDSGGTPTTGYVSLLDGSWHNISINYKGVASDGNTAYLGPDQTAGDHQYDYEFHVGLDGQATHAINSLKGFDAAKTVDGNGIATLVVYDKHFANVADTYVKTTYFASGIHEYNLDTGSALNADSIYAFQGYMDETSFHLESWWKDTAHPGRICDCPLETLWGDNSQRLTGGQVGSSAAYGFTPMDNTPGIPHDLMNPQSVMTKPGDFAYLEPFPKGMYRCEENLPGHTTKAKCTEDTLVGRQAHSDFEDGVEEAIDHWTASVGGMESYYRWGDVPTDCQNCVNDARGYTSGISDDEDYSNVEAALKRSADNSGSIDWRDLSLLITIPESIYVEGSSGSGSGEIVYLDAISNCAATGNHVITHLNIPYLHYVRAIYTGDGACAVGQCVASLYYRKEK